MSKNHDNLKILKTVEKTRAFFKYQSLRNQLLAIREKENMILEEMDVAWFEMSDEEMDLTDKMSEEEIDLTKKLCIINKKYDE